MLLQAIEDDLVAARKSDPSLTSQDFHRCSLRNASALAYPDGLLTCKASPASSEVLEGWYHASGQVFDFQNALLLQVCGQYADHDFFRYQRRAVVLFLIQVVDFGAIDINQPRGIVAQLASVEERPRDGAVAA